MRKCVKNSPNVNNNSIPTYYIFLYTKKKEEKRQKDIKLHIPKVANCLMYLHIDLGGSGGNKSNL